MSNTRKRKPTASSGPPRRTDPPVLTLDKFEAVPMTKPGAAPLVALGLRGADLETGQVLSTSFVMFPDEARALIAQLQQALPD